MSDAAAARPPFASLDRQHQAVSFGMWVFLASEVLLFAGLFAGYAVYRNRYPEPFLAAGRETDIVYGTVNTAIMLTSSLAIAIAGRAAQAGLARIAHRLLIVTFALGVLFLVLKGFEYADDIERHLVPGAGFAIVEQGAQLFFAYYWIMTGVHAAHVTGGLAAVLSGAWAWFGAAFGASLVFALIESVEFMFAEWLQEPRGELVEPDR